MSKAPVRRFGKGPRARRMHLGQTLPLNNGLKLKLVYVEDSIPVFMAKPKGRRAEVWTESEENPGLYYRCCRCPSRKKPADFDKLISKAMTTRGLMDATVRLLSSGAYSFESGRA